MSLHTVKRIHFRQWEEPPIDDELIQSVEEPLEY